jgi:hypothetical protein
VVLRTALQFGFALFGKLTRTHNTRLAANARSNFQAFCKSASNLLMRDARRAGGLLRRNHDKDDEWGLATDELEHKKHDHGPAPFQAAQFALTQRPSIRRCRQASHPVYRHIMRRLRITQVRDPFILFEERPLPCRTLNTTAGPA